MNAAEPLWCSAAFWIGPQVNACVFGSSSEDTPYCAESVALLSDLRGPRFENLGLKSRFEI
jgi:hypothetical protein